MKHNTSHHIQVTTCLVIGGVKQEMCQFQREMPIHSTLPTRPVTL